MEHITVKEILEATGGRLLCGSADTPLDHLSIDSRTMKGNDYRPWAPGTDAA